MYMANVSPNARGTNATYIPPAHVGLALVLWGLALGQEDFALGPRGFSDTNMLVLAIQITCVGGQTQSEYLFRVYICWGRGRAFIVKRIRYVTFATAFITYTIILPNITCLLSDGL